MNSNQSHASLGWARSIAFWCCLFTTAGLYAAVVLSPKLLTQAGLEQRVEFNQRQLAALEDQIDRLDRTIDALQNDPAYQREKLRLEFDAVQPDEQRIPVSPDLSLHQDDLQELPVVRISGQAWYVPLLHVVADSPAVADAMLVAAIALTLYAFTWLGVSSTESTVEAELS